jgi:hypothetical protein
MQKMDEIFIKRLVGSVLAIIVIFAALIRILGISAYPMYDEAASWTFATLPWNSFWKVMWDYEANMVLYYLILRAWVYLGDSETVLRSLSVIFGVATVFAIYDLGSRLFNRRTGVIAAGFLTVHALHIEWSQQARGYSSLRKPDWHRGFSFETGATGFSGTSVFMISKYYSDARATDSVWHNNMIGCQTSLMALIHCGVSRFNVLCEKLGIKQRRSKTIFG